MSAQGSSGRTLVVVGGGITGLAAAWEASSRPDIRVVVVEAEDRLGGKILTTDLDLPGGALTVDEGADAFLARIPDAVELCRELGLDAEFTEPASGRAKVFVDGELRWFPTQHVLGVPLDADDLAATGILGPEGLAEATAETSYDGPAPDGDVAIGPYLAQHFGRELVDHVVGPLVGGINAGEVDELSLRAVTPQLAEAAADGGSLTEALRRRRVAAPPAGPVFHGLRGGTTRLVEALAAACRDRGVTIHTSAAVVSCVPGDAGCYVVGVVHGQERTERITADAVVVTSPAPAAAALVRHLSTDAARELDSIEHCSVALVTLAYRREDVPVPVDASGFLVPRDSGLLLTAASWGSTKWAHWDDGHHVILRVSAGHASDDRGATLDDDALLDGLRSDLTTTMGITAAPVLTRITRWRNGFAQYTVGHLDRADRIDAGLDRDAPGVRVTGAAMRGVGIPACIRQGRTAVRDLLGSPVP
jgi:oxygen-dependent protoporphyrinogen oxidase